jgi:hypothetical protein
MPPTKARGARRLTDSIGANPPNENIKTCLSPLSFAGLSEIRFIGSHVDRDGHYTIVGHANHVRFEAPPELALFLFGVPVLTDVEFAVEESGVLLPGP